MRIALFVLAFVLFQLAFAYGLGTVLRRRREREERMYGQLRDLCLCQQHWIRRGEVACTDCPELGACVSLGACQRERRPVTTTILIPKSVFAELSRATRSRVH